MNKPRHYDMIVAKAANMELVQFYKAPDEDWWQSESDNSDFPCDLELEYFLCLPQHKEACLHWLNGGEAQIKNGDKWDDEWSNEAWSKSWSESSFFMVGNEEIRIKPKKEINQRYAEIYRETQRLAEELAFYQGWGCKNTLITYDHPSSRVRSAWELASKSQEFLNGHEMADIIEDLEESGYFDDIEVEV